MLLIKPYSIDLNIKRTLLPERLTLGFSKISGTLFCDALQVPSGTVNVRRFSSFLCKASMCIYLE